MFNKIQCFIWVYYDLYIIDKCVQTLLRYPNLELNIIENFSEYTEEHIKPYFLKLVDENKVKRYFLFDENITNNAWEMAIASSDINLLETPFVLLSDGDLSTDKDGWLEELISIMHASPNIFAAGVDLLTHNMPTGVNWIPKPKAETPLFYSAETGTHFCLIQSNDFKKAFEYIREDNLPFRDTSLHTYCKKSLKTVWARTKKNKLYHHTWDYLKDPHNKYIKTKNDNFDVVWDHGRYCSYTLYKKDTSVRFEYSPSTYRGRNMNEYHKKYSPKVGTINNVPLSSPNKLHIGCGPNYMNGWINIDIGAYKVDMVHDARKPFQVLSGVVSLIYNEHFIEHLTIQEGVAFLKECYRMLRPGGILRVAAPNMESVLKQYYDPNWKEQAWLKKFNLTWIQTKCELINMGFYAWDHKYLYDEEELSRRLKEAGFKKPLVVCRIGESTHTLFVSTSD